MEGQFWLIVNAVIWVVPLYRILPRAGMNKNIAFVAAIPAAGMILLWVLAFRRWPAETMGGGYR